MRRRYSRERGMGGGMLDHRWWLSGCVAIYTYVDSHDLLRPPSLDVLICVLGLRVLAGGVGFEVELLGATVAGLTRPPRLPSPCKGTRAKVSNLSVPEGHHGET